MLILSDLKQSSSQPAKAKLLLELAMAYVHKPGEDHKDLDTAMILIRQAEAINTASIHDREIEAGVYYALSSALRERGDTAAGHPYINKAIDIYKTLPASAAVGEAYLESSRYYDWRTPKKADFVIETLEKARENFEKSGSHLQLGYVLKMLADWNMIDNKIGRALPELNEALVYYQNEKGMNIQDVYSLLVKAHTYIGDYPTAIQYGLLAEKAAIRANDTALVLMMIYIDLAQAYNSWTAYNSPDAMAYSSKAMGIALRCHEDATFLDLLLNLAHKYNKNNRPQQAIKVLNECLKSAKIRTFIDSLEVKASFIKTYVLMGRPDKARPYIDDVMNKLGREREHLDRHVRLWFDLIDYFVSIHDYKKAELFVINAISATTKSGINGNTAIAYLYKSKIDSAKGDFKSSLANYKVYKKMNDSLFTETKSFQFEQMQAAYKITQKEDSLKLERQNNQLLAQKNQADLSKASLIRNVILASAILSLLLLFIGYRLKQISNKRLYKQQIEINLKNDSLTRMISEKNQLIEEKEWLVKEIHHRVKNNLQIITSLLNTQSKHLENDEAIKAIAESRHRLYAMSLLHQKLYQSDVATEVSMPPYIQELSEYLQTSFTINKKVAFQINVDPISLDISQAIPLGLILNETLTNAIKYAFVDSEKGNIYIRMHEVSDKICLLIKDDGCGLPDNFDLKNASSMGIKLIKGLTRQINGQLSVNSEDGTEICLTFAKEVKIWIRHNQRPAKF